MTKFTSLALFGFIMLAPSVGYSAPVEAYCPGTADPIDREYILTTDPTGATCLMTGTGNNLNGNAFDDMIEAGWTLLDKDDGTGLVDNDFSYTMAPETADPWRSGTFSLDASWWSLYDRLAIGFKVGNTDPTWAVFELPFPETDGLWRTLPREGGALSHALLYGIGEPSDDRGVTDTAVPEPTSLLLLGGGLSLLARRRMRRNQNKA